MIKLLVLLSVGLNALALQEVTNRTDIVTQSVVTVSMATSQTVALAANKYRRYLYIRNMDASEVIYLSFSGNVTGTGMSAGSTIKIAAGAAWEPSIPPIDKIILFTVNAPISASIMSGN